MPVPVLDGHNDVLLRLRRGGHGFLERGEEGHLDLPRAREGGFAGGFFAVFVPDAERGEKPEIPYRMPVSPPLDREHARREAEATAEGLYELERQGAVKIFRAVGDFDPEQVNAILHLEGADPLAPDLSDLESWYERGVRSIGLVWSRRNDFGEGVPFAFPSSPDTGPGLTDAGRELVRACNRLGILVDLSHLNRAGFLGVAGLSEAPLVATHSNAHALCPASRNLEDDQLDAIRDSGGIVGVNFAVTFLREDGHEILETPVERIVDHFEYLVERMGIDHVGFGSDFDGADIPAEVGDASGLPRVIEALRARGYDEPAVRKLAHENWLRVLGETWR